MMSLIPSILQRTKYVGLHDLVQNDIAFVEFGFFRPEVYFYHVFNGVGLFYGRLRSRYKVTDLTM